MENKKGEYIMGLDQSVVLVEKKDNCGKEDNESYCGLEGWIPSDENNQNKFYWRKHSRLQVFMADKFKKQNPTKINSDSEFSHLGFNCDSLFITGEILDDLDLAIKNDYLYYFASDGYFWGQQFQEEAVKEYKKQDKEFLKWARKQIKAKKNIIYTCSW